MSVYHFAAQVINFENRNVVAAAAYRSGEKLTDQRTGLTFNYSRRKDVAYRRIIAPKNAPSWVQDRQTLWSQVNLREARRDAQTAREIHISLCHELTLAQNVKLIETFVFTQFVRKGMICDLTIHQPKSQSVGDARKNIHAHLLLTMRECTELGFGPKRRDWNSVAQLETWRAAWAAHANRKLLVCGHGDVKIDHRTLEEQGILDREPKHFSYPVYQRRKQKEFVEHKTNHKENNMNPKDLPQPKIVLPPQLLRQTAEERKHQLHIHAPNIDDYHPFQQLFSAPGDRYKDWLLELFQDKAYERPDIIWCYANGETAYKIPVKGGTGAIFDCGKTIRFTTSTTNEIDMAIKLAKAKGWTTLNLGGNSAFKREAWIAAIRAGFPSDQVSGYVASAKDLEAALLHASALSIVTSVKPPEILEEEQSESGGQSTGACTKPDLQVKRKKGGPRV